MRLSFQPQCGLVAVPREDTAARASTASPKVRVNTYEAAAGTAA
jgi:hypothetical protein